MMFIMILEITSFMHIFKGWVSWVKSIQEKMCPLIISQGVGFALCNNWRYFCLTKSSLMKHAITLLFTNPPTYIMCSIICMFIRNVKQAKRSKGRNIFLVSFEMLLPSHKAIIETWQIHYSLVFLHELCFAPFMFSCLDIFVQHAYFIRNKSKPRCRHSIMNQTCLLSH
jgi:hypothetical protein